jgi:hypothetical protein
MQQLHSKASGFGCLALFMLIVSSSQECRGQQTESRIVDLGPQAFRMDLFLHDDALIAERDGLELRTANIRRHPANPVVVRDRSWEIGVFNYTCVIQDREQGLYKMWYQMIVSNPGDNKSRCHYAFSRDGIHWEKPALGVVEFEGSKENNIVFEELDGIRGTPSYWVYKDYAEVDPGKRYKMMLQSWGFQGRSSKMAWSPDGVHWTMSEYGNLPGPFDSQNGFYWDDRIGQYAGYFRSHERGYRSVSRATSPDGYHWSRPVTVHTVDDHDPPTWHLYIPGVYQYGAARNTYIMLTTGYDDTANEMYPQLGISRDGVHFHRFREPFIPPGDKGTWDAGSTRGIGSEIVFEGQTGLYYHGSSVGGHVDGGSQGIGLATIQEGAFVGWNAATTGTLTTHRLRARHHHHDKFFLNVDAEGGSVRAELLDDDGNVLPGFSRPDCRPITTAGSKVRVEWAGAEQLESHLQAGTVRLRLHVEKATVYGFHCVTGD